MKKIIYTILAITLATTLWGQTVRTSYFMDKYTNRHQRNPALTPAWGYVNIPVAGNIHLGLQTNMRLSNYLFPDETKSGQLRLFAHPDVNSDDFLNRIGKRGEHLNVDVNVGILSFGFYTNNDHFWSFDWNLRANAGMNLPRDFVGFLDLKNLELGTGKTYNFKDLNVAGRAYNEFAFGHARDINEDLRVGGKLKFLIGHADVRAMVDDLTISTTPDVWKITTHASGSVLGNLSLFRDSAGIIKGLDTAMFENFEIRDLLGGFGGAIDLGMSYSLDNLLGNLFPSLPLHGFTVSFGLTDLGFIRYKNSTQAQNRGGQVMHDISTIVAWYEDSLRTFDFNALKDQAMNMLELRTVPSAGAVSRGLRTTTNLGLEYSFLDNKMSAGVLWSTYFGLPKRFSEITLSYNLRPANWFALSLSSSIAHGFFRSAGWAMNFTPKYGLNLFIGMDYIPFAWTPKWDLIGVGLPIYTTNINVNFGLSVPLGRNRYHKHITDRVDAFGSFMERSVATE